LHNTKFEKHFFLFASEPKSEKQPFLEIEKKNVYDSCSPREKINKKKTRHFS
jgi:hypothetical protein